MASNEDVLLTFDAKDNVSAVASKIGSSVSGMSGTVRSAVQNIASEFGGIDSAINGAFSAITGKSIYDQIMGTTSTAETNKVLLSNMTSTQEAAETLYKTVDNVTNNSLTSMQDLIPALNQIKSATAASDKEITNISDDVANFGAYVSAMTGSSELAKTAMGDLAKGIDGAFASLDQYGISENALMNTGLWNGKEDDVEGYMAAVTEVIGSTDALMNTNVGLDAQINKAFSRGGKRIGNDFLPYIEAAKRGFLDLDNSLGGRLTEGILAAGAAVTGLSTALSGVGQLASSINGIWTAFDNITGAIKGAFGITQVETAAEVANNAAKASNLATTVGLTDAQLAHQLALNGMTVDEYANIMSLNADTLAKEGNTVATEELTVANAGLSASLLASPITWIVAILAVLAVAVYEVGVAFGWWKDLPSMFSSISSGIQRIWSAFANSPQVQGTIDAIKNAFNGLINYLQPLKDIFMNLFPSFGEAGEWDIVGDLINMGSQVGNTLGQISAEIQPAVQGIVEIFSAIGDAIKDVYTAVAPAVNELGKAFSEVFAAINGGSVNTDTSQDMQNLGSAAQALGTIFRAIATVIRIVAPLIGTYFAVQIRILATVIRAVVTVARTMYTVFMAVYRVLALIRKGVQTVVKAFQQLPQTIRRLPNQIRTIFNQILQRIIQFGKQASTNARNAGRRILTGIISFVQSIPSGVATFFAQVVARIAGFAGSAYSAAMSVGQQAMNGISGIVSQIPGKVYSEFRGIAQRVISVGGELYNAAQQAAQKLWDGFNSILQRHSPGVFMRSIEAEFAGIPGMITQSNGAVYSSAQAYANRLAAGFGNPQLRIGNNMNMLSGLNRLATNNTSLNASSIANLRDVGRQYSNTRSTKSNVNEIHIHEGAIKLDARNLTTKESKQVMINALEGLGALNGVSTKSTEGA